MIHQFMFFMVDVVVMILAPGNNVNPVVLSTSGPNLVLLEESEPNSPFIALTRLTIRTVLLHDIICYTTHPLICLPED